MSTSREIAEYILDHDTNPDHRKLASAFLELHAREATRQRRILGDAVAKRIPGFVNG